MVAWRIYYDDGATFDSDDGDPQDAPSFGVLCIVFPDAEVGRLVMQGWDWYFYHPTEENWWGCDIYGLLDRLLHNLPMVAVKQGRSAPTQVWRAVLKSATTDPDFPGKSACARREYPGVTNDAR